jgi:Alginate export
VAWDRWGLGVLTQRKKLQHNAAGTILCVARIAVLTAMLALLCVAAASQEPADTPARPADDFKALRIASLTVSGELRGRGQGWNWFLGDNRTRYAFGGTVLNLGISQQLGKFSWNVELSQPTLYNLPRDAFQPGTGFPLGLGAIYFLANDSRRNVAGIFLKQGYVGIRGIDRNHSLLRIGRFDFLEGQERTPRTKDLAWLKQERIAQRLIGDSEWTGISRSFDGVHFSDNLGGDTNLTFVAGRATSGVWQTDAMGEMDVDILYGAYTREFSTPHTDSELRVFGLEYHDGRGVLKVDNRGRAARQSDTNNIRIGTFGVNYALVTPLPYIGKWDLVVWGAQQVGHWGSLRQRANSALFELGWRPPVPWIRPWLRAGAFFAGGDGNPNDDKHQTFFQPLPTMQLYARLPFYTLQNIEDYSGQAIFQPTRKLLLRAEVHKVKLHSVKDGWYQGSGAFQDSSFGYYILPNNGHRGLGNYVDFNADYQVNPHLWLRYYIGALSGKGAETSLPSGRKAGFTYLEFAYRF